MVLLPVLNQFVHCYHCYFFKAITMLCIVKEFPMMMRLCYMVLLIMVLLFLVISNVAKRLPVTILQSLVLTGYESTDLNI